MTPASGPDGLPDPIEEARRQWVAHGWEDAAEGMVAVTTLMRAHQLVLARVDAVLRPFDLTFARYELLMLLHLSRSGALPMSKIGVRLQVHPTSITSAVDRLERQGLVRRQPHPDDRRATLVAITDEGHAVVRKATDELNGRVFAALGTSPAQTQDLVRALGTVRRTHGD